MKYTSGPLSPEICIFIREKAEISVFIVMINSHKMKNLFNLLSVSALCLAFVCSCAKEAAPVQSEPDPEPANLISATVTLPEDGAVKLAYSENDPANKNGGLASVWEEGDYFFAMKDGKDLVRFNIQSGVGTNKGSFTAYTSYTKDTQWKVILGKNVTGGDGVANCSYLDQNGTVDSLGSYDYVVSDPVVESDPESELITKFEVDFSTGTRLSYFMRIKLPAGIRYIEYCTTTSWNVTSGGVAIAYDGNFDNVSMIDLGHDSAAGECCYLSIPATQYMYRAKDIAGGASFENPVGVIITFFNADMNKSNGKVFNNNVTGKGGKIATMDVSSMTLIDRPLASEAIDFGPVGVVMKKDEGGVNSYDNLIDAYYSTVVDPAWSPYNLGARGGTSDYHDRYGEYYSWGEAAPRATVYNASGAFSEGAYTYKGDKTVGDQTNFPSTDLGYREQYQTTQGRMVLQHISGTKYDAARVRWGSEWRMPTAAEVYAFTGSSLTYTNGGSATSTGFSVTSYKDNRYTTGFYAGGGGCPGLKFSKGGQEIFFPYGGYYSPDHNLDYNRCFIWSGSRIRATPSNGDLNNSPLCGEFTPGSDSYKGYAPYYGLNIRPVLNRRPENSGSASTPFLGEDGGVAAYNVSGTVKDNSGNGIAGVVVSDGYRCWKTNTDGSYYIMANPAARTISITVPAGYQIPLGSDGRPAFFKNVTIPTGSGKLDNTDFTLFTRASASERFTIIAIADAHVANDTDLAKFQTSINDITNTAKTLTGTGIPVGSPANEDAGDVIAIALGDQLTNNMGMADKVIAKFTSIKDNSGNTVPVFYVIGNHDHDSSKTTDYDCEGVFVNKFAPTNYSFDIGNAHIMVMDDIIATGTGVAGQTAGCREGFTTAQVAWLMDDISKVNDSKNKIGILCVHAPLANSAGGDANTQSNIMSALKNNFNNVHVLSGHTHCLKNNLYRGWAAKSGRSIYEHTLQSLAGYWWSADVSYNEASPSGYGVMTFDSDDIYAEYNKVTKEAASFQMRNYDGGATYNKTSSIDKIRYGGKRGYKEYTWPSPVKGKLVTRIFDAGPSNDESDYWEVKRGSTAMTRVSSDNPVADACAASYMFNKLQGDQGDANKETDQIWYSSDSYSSSFTVTAIHHMMSGWKATYTSSSIVGTDYKGFAYGERY